MILFFAALLVFAALVFTLFVRSKDIPEPLPVSPIQHLDDRKHAIYENLRDLQFEYRLGKLSDDDYQQTKQALQRELATVLAETEELVKRLGLAPVRATAKSRALNPPQSKAAQNNAPQISPAPATTEGSRCTHCGAAFSERLKYCGECGRAIA